VKTKLFCIIAVITLTLIGCGGDDKPNTTEHIHDWNNWTETTPANCTSAGEQTRTCKLDPSHTETQPISALGHDWDDWKVTKAPTTTAEGVKTRTCKRDATHIETQTIDKLPDTEPHNQTATITNLFNKGYNATVQGYLTDTEWNGVADKIKSALETEYDVGSDGIKENLFNALFGQTGGITIIVEKNPAYANYSVTRSSRVMHINFAILNNTNTLRAALLNASKVADGNPGVPESG